MFNKHPSTKTKTKNTVEIILRPRKCAITYEKYRKR